MTNHDPLTEIVRSHVADGVEAAERAIEPYEAASLATRITPRQIEEVVAALPAAECPTMLVRLEQAREMIAALRKGIEQRMVADGQTGQEYVIDGETYGFYGAQRRGFDNIPTLLINLGALGIALPGIAEVVSDMRVTGLRELASGLKNADRRALALELIESHRVAKGERGAPHMQLVDRP